MPTKTYLILVLFALAATISESNEFYKKIIHNTDPQAKCLDGSPGMLYIHEGSQKDKFLIYFIGGGFCGQTTFPATIESCYQRSKTSLGSSTLWPDYITDQTGAEGLISINNDTLYKNWTKVLVAYCDGAMHQGGSDAPIPYKDTNLYFRGNRIVRSHFKWLIQTYQMNTASKIMLTGGSAGGIAAFLWGNYLQWIVNDPQSVYIIPDSGIFVNVGTYKDNEPIVQTAIINLMKLAHLTQKSPIETCNNAYPGQEYKCLFFEQNYKFLTGKYLFINSQYDQWAISNSLRIKCLSKGTSGQTPQKCSPQQLQAIQDYRDKYMKLINSTIRIRQNWGIWSIACSQHVYQPYNQMYNADLQKVPQKAGLTVKDAIQKFIFQEKTLWTVDQNPWPYNQQCAY